jgi:hypothetical protein
VAYDNKIELQVAPQADAQRPAGACPEKFGVRELALAFIARRSPRARSNVLRLTTPLHSLLNASIHWPHRHLIANDNPTRILILSDQRESKGPSFRSRQLKPPGSRLLIANLELEFFATNTKRGLLRFPNRKKIAVFDPHRCGRFVESQELSSPFACRDHRCRPGRAANPHISNRNSRFTEFRSTYYKHTSYQISNRNKNAHFAFPDSPSASHQSHAANRESRNTTRAAFRSTIPARPHAYR